MNTNVPIWILGSSLYGAQLAAHFGLPYAFASHFAPEQLLEAMKIYRELFKPSTQQAKPYSAFVMNVVAPHNVLLQSSKQMTSFFISIGRHYIHHKGAIRFSLLG